MQDAIDKFTAQSDMLDRLGFSGAVDKFTAQSDMLDRLGFSGAVDKFTAQSDHLGIKAAVRKFGE